MHGRDGEEEGRLGHRAALVGLLQQLGAVLRGLGGEGLVGVLVEAAHVLQRARRQGHRGELSARVGDLLLVDLVRVRVRVRVRG